MTDVAVAGVEAKLNGVSISPKSTNSKRVATFVTAKDKNDDGKIITKIKKCVTENKSFYSFEYFPPKTEAGVLNLYDRYVTSVRGMSLHNKSVFCDCWYDIRLCSYDLPCTYYVSIDRMSLLGPMFMDCTWGGK